MNLRSVKVFEIKETAVAAKGIKLSDDFHKGRICVGSVSKLPALLILGINGMQVTFLTRGQQMAR